MAISNYGPYDVQSFPAAVDLDTKTGYFGTITATGVNLVGDAGIADGVIVNVEKAGVGATIGLMTTSGRLVPVVVNAAVLAGAKLGSGAGGKSNTAATNDAINGIAIDAGGADLDLVTCLFGYKGVQA
jgi:hypothetical protein